MRRLISDHAEDVGGIIVEPGAEFDETEADEAVIERLDSEGKLADAEKASRKGKGD